MTVRGTITLISLGNINKPSEYEINGHRFFCNPITNKGITRKLNRAVAVREPSVVWYRESDKLLLGVKFDEMSNAVL